MKAVQNSPAEAQSPTPLVYTVAETAIVLRSSTKTVRRLIKRGFFAPSKALRKLLIPRSQVEAFLKSTCGNPKALL